MARSTVPAFNLLACQFKWPQRSKYHGHQLYKLKLDLDRHLGTPAKLRLSAVLWFLSLLTQRVDIADEIEKIV